MSQYNYADVAFGAAKGEEYWRQERAICAAMLRHPACAADSSPESARHLSIEQIHAASQAKSFDYRVRAHPVP